MENEMAKKKRNTGSAERARAKRATPPNNERRERVGQVLLRRLLDNEETQDTAADFARRSDATSRMNRPLQAMPAAVEPTRPTPRPSRAPTESQRPTTRPSTKDEREAAERGDRAARREAGMKAGGKVKKMREGGMCRGMGAATRGGRFMKDG